MAQVQAAAAHVGRDDGEDGNTRPARKRTRGEAGENEEDEEDDGGDDDGCADADIFFTCEDASPALRRFGPEVARLYFCPRSLLPQLAALSDGVPSQ